MKFKPKLVEPINISDAHKGLKYCSVNINGKEYTICDKASANRWSNKKRGNYGRGLINTQNDPHKAERIGLLGELAFAKIFDLEVDFSYKHGGDNNDFVNFDYSVDIKTASKYYGKGLIYAFSEGRKKIKLKSDIYVFAFAEHDSRSGRGVIVNLVGWEWRENIMKKCGIKQSPVGIHYNYEVPYNILLPIKDLHNFLD